MGKRGHLSVALVIFSTILSARAQTPPCPAGTLANVLGTSCSVGPLTLNFQSSFTGFHNVFDQGVETTVPISAAEIGFIPVQRDQQAGFKLITNFVDGPGPDSTISSAHNVSFVYTAQANQGFDIVAEFLDMDATLQNGASNPSLAQVRDFQNFPNIFSSSLNVDLSSQGGTITSQLTDHIALPAPALFSTGFANDPQAATTFFESFNAGTAQTTLESATFLYNVGPIGPLPPAHFVYSNIDLPGEAITNVSGITNSGRMVGAYQDTQGVFHGYITRGRTGFVPIDFPNATATFGNGLNDRGDLIGSYTDAAGNNHGFLLQDQQFSTLDFPGAIITFPIGINDQREIVGLYETADQGIHGFVFAHGIFTAVDHNPANVNPPLTELLGINNHGQMVGLFIDFIQIVGLSQQGDSFQGLFVPGQINMEIDSVNEQGDLVGTYNDINNLIHGFVGKGDHFRTVDFPTGNRTFPLGINSSGRIVGLYTDAAGALYSFLAEPREDDGDDASTASNASLVSPGTAQVQPTPLLTCGTAEWRQHPEQMRLCKIAQTGH